MYTGLTGGGADLHCECGVLQCLFILLVFHQKLCEFTQHPELRMHVPNTASERQTPILV